MESAHVRHKLVEKTAGPHYGEVWREEEMTTEEAADRNSRIEVMQWEPCCTHGNRRPIDGDTDAIFCEECEQWNTFTVHANTPRCRHCGAAL